MTDPHPSASQRATRHQKDPHGVRSDGMPLDFLKIGISPFDWRDPYHFAVTISWGMFVRGALACMLVIHVVFASLYLAVPGAVQNLPPRDVFMAFFFSVETLATVGYGEMAPAGIYGHAIAAVEIIIGMASTAILTGLVFVRFARPRARFLFADHLVITRHNGRETLMLRLANGRFNTLTSARARLGVVIAEVTDEGQAFMAVHDLALLRSEMPIFPMTWTIMHVIDASSPLHTKNPAHLAAMKAQFFVALEARDTGLQATVQDFRSYHHSDIAHGMRYAEAVSRDESGRATADLSKLSAIEPSPETPASQRAED